MSQRPGLLGRCRARAAGGARSVWQERRDIGLASVSGVGVFLCYPDWDWFPLAFVTLAPLLLAVGRGSARRAFLLALWAGFLTNLGGFYWVVGMLQDYGYMPWSVSTFLYALLCAQQGLVWGAAVGVGRWAETRGAPDWLAYPAALAVAESVMPLIFPWYFGNSQYLNLPFIQLAEVGGVVLLSSILMLSNVALAAVWRHRRTRLVVAVASLLIVVHAAGALRVGAVRAAVADAPTFEVGIVQANIGIYDKHEPGQLSDQLLLHQRLSAELEASGAELIVWPETAYAPPGYVYADDERGQAVRVSGQLDRYATRIPPSRAPLVATSGEDGRRGTESADRFAAQRGFSTPLITGTLMWSRRTEAEMDAAPPRGGRPWPWDIHNSAILLDNDGMVLGAYDKTLRMIFSEYVPGGRLLWRLTGINLYRLIPAAGDFFPGRPTNGFVLPTAEGEVRIGAMICYEDIMPAFGRAIHAGRPHFIVNVTNDAWFGDTAEPRLHLALAVFRAVEQRTTLIRATNTGVSAFIAPDGHIAARTETFVEATLQHSTPLLEATTTPFMRWGNWPPWLLGLALLGTVLRTRSARREPGDVA